jgi:hypothetical protein
MLDPAKRCIFEIVQILSFECVSAKLLASVFSPYLCLRLTI